MDVIATGAGYYGKNLREPGDRFTLRPGDKLASWMAPDKSFAQVGVPGDEGGADKPKRRGKAKPAEAEPAVGDGDPLQ